MTSEELGSLQVLDPTADVYGEGADPLTPSLNALGGKTLGLVWNGKPNGDVALKAGRRVDFRTGP